MAITIRTDETLKQLEKLKTKLGIKTASGVVDFIALDYMDLKTQLDDQKTINFRLETELREVKEIVISKIKADHAFNSLSDKT